MLNDRLFNLTALCFQSLNNTNINVRADVVERTGGRN